LTLLYVFVFWSIQMTGIVNLAARGMFVVSVARRLGRKVLAGLLICPALDALPMAREKLMAA
jgi:hypothetical protein